MSQRKNAPVSKGRGAVQQVYAALAARPAAEVPADPTQTPLPRGTDRSEKIPLADPHRLPFGQMLRGLASSRG